MPIIAYQVGGELGEDPDFSEAKYTVYSSL